MKTDSFLSGYFIQAGYFESTKDRVIRSLKTYFESRRADSLAVYYRDALLASKDLGIDASLLLAQKSKLEDVQAHFDAVLSNPEIYLECLFTGNVSAQDSKAFYEAAASKILESQKSKSLIVAPSVPESLIPGTLCDTQIYLISMKYSSYTLQLESWNGESIPVKTLNCILRAETLKKRTGQPYVRTNLPFLLTKATSFLTLTDSKVVRRFVS